MRHLLRLMCCFVILFGIAVPARAQDEAVITQLREIIRHEMAAYDLPALSVVIVDNRRTIWQNSFGTYSGKRTNEHTTYRIGSVSKLFTDIAVMQLVEVGLLDLDAPVTTYLPDFRPNNPFGAPITLRHLMSHQSGLLREPPVGNYFDELEPDLALTVASLNATTLLYRPGIRTKYSNAGIAVVGRVLEVFGRQPFADYLQDAVLAPLNMQESAFVPRPDLIARMPEGIMWNYQGERFPAARFELGMSPAGSMYSNMHDLSKFMRALLNWGQGESGRMLSADMLAAMWNPQRTSSGRSLYGLGFRVGEVAGQRVVHHGGAIYGFATQFAVLPEAKLGIAIATNLDVANGLLRKIVDHALASLLARRSGRSVPRYVFSRPVPRDEALGIAGTYRGRDGYVDLIWRLNKLYLERIGGKSYEVRTDGRRMSLDGLSGFKPTFSVANGMLMKIGGTAYVREREPAPVQKNPVFEGLIGEYGGDHNVLYILEKRGQLHALIEWATEYPLTDMGNDVYAFPDYGLYPLEQLKFLRDRNGRATEINLDAIQFLRRNIEPDAATGFRVSLPNGAGALIEAAKNATPPVERRRFRPSDLVDAVSYDGRIHTDIRYAGDNNFLGEPVYAEPRAFLQRPAAEALGRVAKRLAPQGYGLLIHDAYRPWYVTKVFWDATPDESRMFVADPSQGSRHNRGAAVDLTLYAFSDGAPVEMVSGYDEMSARSLPDYPGGWEHQRQRRDILRNAMESEGFTVYENEWWHYDYKDWQEYPILNKTFEELDVAATGQQVR